MREPSEQEKEEEQQIKPSAEENTAHNHQCSHRR
jgi:hypothetical protein